MLFKLLLGRINWFEWMFIAAFAVLSITVVIQGYRMKINQLELQKAQATAQALEYENKFMSASKVIDDKVINNVLNEIEQLNVIQHQEKPKFYTEYKKLLADPDRPGGELTWTEPPNRQDDPVVQNEVRSVLPNKGSPLNLNEDGTITNSASPPSPITTFTARVLKPGEVVPEGIRRASAKPALEKLKQLETNPPPLSNKKPTYESKSSVQRAGPSENERARVKLIASRLHNAWSCSQGTPSGCTS